MWVGQVDVWYLWYLQFLLAWCLSVSTREMIKLRDADIFPVTAQNLQENSNHRCTHKALEGKWPATTGPCKILS